jgi:hypothetical protein
MPKLCSHCLQPAQYSILIHLSTLGIKPRVQKSSPAVPLCNDCVRDLSENESWGTHDLQNVFEKTYTYVYKRSPKRSTDIAHDVSS